MERLDIIERLKETPDLVEAAIAGVPDSVLRERPAEGEWSAKEIVGHLRDKAQIWHKRLFMVFGMFDPVLPPFDGEASVIDNAYQEADVARLIEEMRGFRLQTVELLDHAPDWTKIGQHRDLGRRTLKQFAEYVIEMEAEHLADIRAQVAKAASRTG
jgi:hypothetical protein